MSAEPKKLFRSRNDRILAGICGGLGEFFGIDSTVIRVLFALLLIFGGSGILIYLVMLLIVPEEPIAKTTEDSPDAVVEVVDEGNPER